MCCPTIDATVVDGGLGYVDAGGATSLCNAAVAAGDNPQCANTLQNLQIQALCATWCEAVAAVCPFLTQPVMGTYYEGGCFRVAASGNEANCRENLGVLAGSCPSHGLEGGPCGGTTGTGAGGPHCASLAACCPLLSGGNTSACNEVAAEGDEATCQDFLALAQSDHFCQ
jgi:hypothetical protein